MRKNGFIFLLSCFKRHTFEKNMLTAYVNRYWYVLIKVGKVFSINFHSMYA